VSIGQDKFIYTLDLINAEIKEFKNNISSKYEKVYYSKLINNKYTEEELNKLCNKNYVKLVIDIKYDVNIILDLTEKLRTYKPNSVETDYLISLTNEVISESSTDIIKSVAKDNYSYTVDYIKQLYPDLVKVNENINSEKLLMHFQCYYKKSQLSKEERTEQ